MKTPILLAALAVTLVSIDTPSASASDLSFAFQQMATASRTSARTSPRRSRQVTLDLPDRATTSDVPQLLLGVFIERTVAGLRVKRTVAGSSARDALRPGDVLLRVTAANVPTRRIKTMIDLEYAKREIGADRPAAIEIRRANGDIEYVWITIRSANEFARQGNHAGRQSARSLFKGTQAVNR